MEDHPAEPRAPAWIRPAYLLGGLLALGIGVTGVFVPLLPTVPFLLVAAWCFSRSSHRLHRWLVNHPRLGPMIAPFQEGGAMPRRAKVATLITMAVLFGASFIWLLDGLVPRLILAGAAVISFAAVLHIPSRPNDGETAGNPAP